MAWRPRARGRTGGQKPKLGPRQVKLPGRCTTSATTPSNRSPTNSASPAPPSTATSARSPASPLRPGNHPSPQFKGYSVVFSARTLGPPTQWPASELRGSAWVSAEVEADGDCWPTTSWPRSPSSTRSRSRWTHASDPWKRDGPAFPGDPRRLGRITSAQGYPARLDMEEGMENSALGHGAHSADPGLV